MKQHLALILILTILLGLCAGCSKPDSNDTKSDSIALMPVTQEQGTRKNGPEEPSIQLDIEREISVIPNMKLNDISVIKSLTEENYYEATLQITAATNYADWKMECDISYTKYDQGWMLDEIDWNSKEYVIARTPDVDTLSEIANNTEISVYYRDTLPVENATVDVSNVEDTGIIGLHWTKIYDYMHATCIGEYITMWNYDSEIDNWVFYPSDDGFGFIRQETVVPDPVDFSGVWNGSGFISSIEITDFSWSNFNVTMDGSTSKFYQISGHPYSDEESFGWYSNGEGKYIEMSLGPKGTGIQIVTFSGYGRTLTQLFYISIREELPPLN